ncbi:pre-rRNA 2'-O-ribose RNA methyltransferase FTSJ3 [Lethenteron reissneri]|uniref:pre-rRNA 2'-O-ribose RNA methyltransferase FTSJ3 n=1 Tax=Lethenteron reissneri TaxID=7753 RepID=UPI002AB6A71D|nr:pre-rRNA 2'-O-ribose RNA methyltransferase FTSJ3 [Lethenteron reissneri]XP_061417971.1 pre-rRNA 2'-O-ribose RNA methyltransferase FTSJ3 [Lethenteron reissneri]
MGKKSKIGKARRDKFYLLAKETGYRARSAFKLIQLNRKFGFLQRARVLVDLCAAPGGWLQVASKFMPISSLVIGVDLVPIKSIPNVVTLQEDITTDKCRQALKKELQTWKVDCMLNDGAPNVGANWSHDAYAQARLTLQALKLACDFLNKGGWFITKVFRSRDYQPLMWLFQQFFQKVQATKPQASRSESAEIFVVCQGYKAPDKIDSKFFDAKYAFKEVEIEAKTIRDIADDKKKPKAEGYTEGDYTLFHPLPATEFLKCSNPIDFLNKCSQIVLDDPRMVSHPSTTNEIAECCRDIKVLGRKELRSLINWRTKLKKSLLRATEEKAAPAVKAAPAEEAATLVTATDGDISLDSSDGESDGRQAGAVDGSDDDDDNEEEMEKQLADMKSDEVADLKRKKKKLLKERRKLRERMELKMDVPGDSLAESSDFSLFNLKSINKTNMAEMEQGDMSLAELVEVIGPTDDDVNMGDFNEEADGDSADDEEVALPLHKIRGGKRREVTPEPSEEQPNALVVEYEDSESRAQRETNLWFGKDIFAGLETEVDEQMELKHAQRMFKKMARAAANEHEQSTKEQGSGQDDVGGDAKPSQHKEESGSDSDNSDDDDDDDVAQIARLKELSASIKTGRRGRYATAPDLDLDDDDHFETVPIEEPAKIERVLDPEGLAIGSLIATSRKRTRDLVDGSFDRFAFNDEGELPDWFTDDERKHRRKMLPVDKATVAEYRKRWQEINARPIRKIAEAKARKKKRMLKQVEKAQKKAEAVVDTVDISEREKMAQLRSIYKKAGVKKKDKDVTYVVAKRSSGRKVGRPAGVKGHYKVVDARLKKDTRAKLRKEGGKKKGGRKGGR